MSNYVPQGRPGHRAPHLWVTRDGNRVSTLDLFGRGLVLLAGTNEAAWPAAAAARSVLLESYALGGRGNLVVRDGETQRTYGLEHRQLRHPAGGAGAPSSGARVRWTTRVGPG